MNARRTGPAGDAQPAARRFARGLAAASPAAGLLLAACTTTGVPQVQIAAQTVMVDAQQAFASPPPGGPPVLSVTMTRYANAVEQTIALGNSSQRPGQNFVRVQIFGEVPTRMARHATLANDLFDMGDIWEEMDEALPGVGMEVSPFFVRNVYGAFGYAVGRYSNDLCLYAWQRIGEAEANPDPTDHTPGITLRYRLCKTGATERQLLDLVFGITINAYLADPEWIPYRAPLATVIGGPVYPPGDVLDPPRPVATAPRASTPTTPAAPVFNPTGPTIPPPPGAGGGGAGPIVPPPPI